jgi:hypothetical protein
MLLQASHDDPQAARIFGGSLATDYRSDTPHLCAMVPRDHALR